MIQELLGGAGLLGGGGEGNISFNAGVLEGSPSPSTTTTTTTATATATTTTNTTSSSSSSENLRCPRCDSSNTKFCYYNNYNLTQPRHFCKTCRRYWTKGGALRNIPIGGGCRKNKGIIVSTTAGKSMSGKAKTASSDFVKSNLGSGFDHELPSNPILWGSPQNSQLLALYRATQNPNPNPNPNPISNSLTIKDQGAMIGSHVTLESAAASTGALNARTLSLDPLGQVPTGVSIDFWRNNQHHQHQHQHQHQHYHQQNLLPSEVQNAGIQELYQRLRSSANYFNDHSPPVSSSFALTPPIMEPSPIAGGELDYWNPSSSWSDLPTTNTNGAFP